MPFVNVPLSSVKHTYGGVFGSLFRTVEAHQSDGHSLSHSVLGWPRGHRQEFNLGALGAFLAPR